LPKLQKFFRIHPIIYMDATDPFQIVLLKGLIIPLWYHIYSDPWFTLTPLWHVRSVFSLRSKCTYVLLCISYIHQRFLSLSVVKALLENRHTAFSGLAKDQCCVWGSPLLQGLQHNPFFSIVNCFWSDMPQVWNPSFFKWPD
jgi:hypothetical protein